MSIKALGRGLAAGLVAIGKVEERDRKEAEEKRRYENEQNLKKRQLEMQEAESAQRQEKNRIENMMKKAQWKNQQMVKAAVGSNYDPRVMDKAWNQYGNNNGTSWKYNEQKSAAAGNGVIIYDVGTPTQNADGSLKPGPDGKPEVKALPGSMSEMRFESQDDHVNFFLRAQDPAWALAHDQANITAEETRRNAMKVHEQRMKQDPAYALKYGTDEELSRLSIEEKEQTVKLRKAQAGLAERKLSAGVAEQKTPAQAPVSEFTTASGSTKKQTAKDVEKAKSFAASWNKTEAGLESPIDADDAARIMDVKNSKAKQKVIKGYAKKVANGSMTEEEFKAKFEGSQLPDAFVQRMFDKITVMTPEEVKKPNLFIRAWNTIF
jgi:hypothetical protein